jgi:2-oxoglutarate decarboxylase
MRGPSAKRRILLFPRGIKSLKAMAEPATTVQITMPAMGESVTEGVVLEWLKQVGDRVEVDEGLVEISTDKVDAEVPSPAAGVLTAINVGPDETVTVGAVLGEIEVGEGGAAPAADAPADAGDADAAPASPAPAADRGAAPAGANGAAATGAAGLADGDANATPIAARMAADLGVDIAAVNGSGPRDRVTKEDVIAAAAAAVKGGGAAPSAPAPPAGGAAKQIRGPAATLVRFMEESRSIPTATSFRTLTVDTLAARRATLKSAGRKLSFTHLIAWAIVRATDDMPVMADSFASLDGKPQRVTPAAVSLGLAVDVERKDGSRSLVVPVIHDASTLAFPAFVAAYDELVVGARDNTLQPDAYQGANITLTNPGGIGTVASVPRLMPGQGTIVATGAIGYPPGLAKADPQRLAELGVEKVMTMTSTYDHRVIQGAESGQFLKRVDELLQGADGFYDAVFEALGVDVALTEAGPPKPTVTSADPVPASTTPAVSDVPDEALMQAVQGATSIVKAHRVHGHLAAHLDPLGSPPRGDPALDPASVNLTPEMMARIPASVLRVAVPGKTFADALPHLRETYTGTIAYEVEHIAGHNRRVWLRENIESGAHREPLTAEQKRALLARLSQVEALEGYLHKAFLGKKQFSIEGLDMLVPMLDTTIELSAASGAREAVLGMAHRGRLNVLAHTVGQPYGNVLIEFEGEQTLSADTAAPEGGTGDVKYHYGASGTYTTGEGKHVEVTLAPNPSHLEYVNPVIEGRARADQTSRNGREMTHDPSLVVPILIHGDAAFPGQGVVAETLNLQALAGYSTGGTVHVIANNQLGFTTDPTDARSTRWASDLAKGFDVPIIHVNADDPEACIAAARLAVGFRNEFGRDALIDLVGYRRFGHNETDEPAYTQPQMYEKIKAHPTVRAIYAQRLIEEGVVSAEEADELAADAYDAVAKAHAELKDTMAGPPDTGSLEVDTTMSREPKTTLPADLLRSLNEQLITVPEDFNVHRKLKPFLKKRVDAFEAGGKVDWAHAEALAYASLLALGVPVRLTGQDSERGTFSQRHLVLHDAETGAGYTPLQNLPSAAAPFELHNSPLSETACLGFEYGYSIQDPEALVLWEAQFGDFVNSGQVILDQFITSGLAKWGQTSRLTLLLPHGYEGSGPEHSSGRVERFLQAAAEGNIRVANCTTPAQYFHLLRRQALVSKARPLVVMTPKSLLRLPAATSTFDELADGAFQRVIDDPLFAPGGNGSGPRSREGVTKLVLCSGKVYYDIVGNEEREAAEHIAVARVEMLYPFPERELQDLMDSYPNLERVVWVQEEPRNMGPRAYMRRRMAGILPEDLHYYYVGRQLRAAQSEGYTAAHRKEQARIVRVALDLEDDVLKPDLSAERPRL